MSTNPGAVTPLSDSTQLALRLPVILFALAGVVLALVFIRRYGVLSAVLGAIGSAFVAVDQIVNVVWVYTTTAQNKKEGISFDTVVSTQNRFAILDAVLITIGVGLLLAGFVLRRRAAASSPPPPFAPPWPGPSGFPPPPPPGFPPPPSGFPPPPAGQ
jgi:uncharacterized membrane protein